MISYSKNSARLTYMLILRAYLNFFNDTVQYDHLLSAEIVKCSWHVLPSFKCWDPSKIHIGEARHIRDWRGRVLTLPPDDWINKASKDNLQDTGALLLSKRESISPEIAITTFKSLARTVPYVLTKRHFVDFFLRMLR